MTALIWTLLLLVFFGLLVWQLSGRWKILANARNDDGRSYGKSTWATRLNKMLVYAAAQKKFFTGEQPAGLLHILIFWGFMVLLIQVLTMFGRGWFPEFTVPGFSAYLLGKPYALIKDIFEVLIALCVIGAAIRWGITHPKRLVGFLPAEEKLSKRSHWEAYLILFFIFSIVVSGLLYDAGRIVYLAGDPHIEAEKHWQPFSLALSHLFTGNATAAELVTQICWWVHNIIILIFMNLLPLSKHFHIITAIPNVFLTKLEPRGHLPKKNYESEDALFGRSQLDHFTWKQILDMYTCTECGRCSSVCPATATNKPLAPRQFLTNLRDEVYANQKTLGKKTANGETTYEAIIGNGKPIEDEVVWSCLTCRACEEVCPVNIEYIDKIVDMRQHLVQEASRFPEELGRTFKGLENNFNPWGIASAERMGWADGLEVPTVATNPNAEYLLFVGCAGSFDAEGKKATRALVNILKKAEVNFAVLGEQETCNGETARRLGNEYLYQMMAETLTETINATGIKKILVNCPHCFNTFKNEYGEFGGNWDITHAGAFINQLISDGKVALKDHGENRVVYHDSCYFGRYNDIYEEPRAVIDQIPGTKRVEMDKHHSNNTCCGSGGGRMWLEEDADKRVNVLRTDEALEKNPDVIATSCPFCKIMIGSTLNEKGMEDKVKVMDIAEMVDAHM